MQRSDWFAILVGIFILGAGAYLSTFPTEIIRVAGIVLMAGAILGLAAWFAWEYGWRAIIKWRHGWILPLLLCLVFGIAWHFWPAKQADEPRHLNLEQKRTLRDAFRLIGSDNAHNMGIVVATAIGNDECMGYAKDFYDALIAAGIIAGSPTDYSLPLFDPDQTGVEIGVTDPANPAAYALKVQRALKQIGIETKLIRTTPPFATSVLIFIAPD
jgi:hypothetical protein